MRPGTLALIISVLPTLVTPNNIRDDPLSYDENLVIVHLYQKQWPVGIAVSKSGRMFSSFPAGFDALNVNNGSSDVYQVAELIDFETEIAYPNATYNRPPGGPVDTSGPFPVTKGLSDYLLSVQALVIDSNDTLWLMDGGRVSYNGVMLPPSPGGPKVVSIDLETNSVARTYTFPTSVATPVSYLNEAQFDIVRGFAYIGDVSMERNNAIVILNLVTGDSWRVLERDFTVSSLPGFLPFIYGKPVYQVQRSSSGKPVRAEFSTSGIDGLALSGDGETLFWNVDGSRFLFSVPTALLRDRSTPSTDIASAVRFLGNLGFSGGIGIDPYGNILQGNAGQDGVSLRNATTGLTTLFVRDPRVNFVGRFSVTKRDVYFTVNQLELRPANYLGEGPLGVVDQRQRPYLLFRASLP